MVRSAAPELAKLPEFVTAFRSRFREVHDDRVADREIALDAAFVLYSHASAGLRRRRRGALRLARAGFAHAPLFACEFFARQLADAALRRVWRRTA
ncbi:MAG TPA: hypothetical protein VF608_12945 [Thermoanaerobaculia bacterium]